MDGMVLRVAYGEEKHTETMPNGMTFIFDNKIRLTMPDGHHVVLYQTLAASGILYVSANKSYAFHEKGPYVILLKHSTRIFEGVFCRQ